MNNNKIAYQGVTYSSEKEMCETLNFPYGTYLSRKRKGMSLKEIFGTPINIRNSITYQGVTYSSEKAMCKTLNFPYGTYLSRKRKGMSLKEILTTPIGYNCVDHLGNKFKSKTEMCKKYDIHPETFSSRIKQGMCLEDALTIRTGNNNKNYKICIDHLGNIFKTEKEMCEAYNILQNVYQARINRGYSIEKALTKFSTKGKNCTDHLSKEFKTITDMCKYWNIPKRIFIKRIKDGMSLEDALNTPLNNYKCTDHLGNLFVSEREMCRTYNINRSVYKNRINQGMSIKDALTVPKHMSLGEYRIKKSLEYRQIRYKHNKTLKTIFKEFNLNVPWEEFIDVLYEDLISKGITTWEKAIIGKLRPDFVLYKDQNNKIIGIIEFDGKQHFGLVEYFFKTIQQFIYCCDCDIVKNKFFEFMSLPLLRIRYDQVNLIEPILDDFLSHPEEYISKKHNPYLTEEEYWAELYDTFKKIDDDNLGYNPS